MNELNNVPIIYIIVLEYFSKKRGHNFEELDTINVESSKLCKRSLEILEYFFQKFEIINFDNYVITFFSRLLMISIMSFFFWIIVIG